MHQYKAPDCKVRSHMRKITWKKKRGAEGCSKKHRTSFHTFPHSLVATTPPPPTSATTVSLLCSQTRCAACCFERDGVRACCVCARACAVSSILNLIIDQALCAVNLKPRAAATADLVMELCLRRDQWQRCADTPQLAGPAGSSSLNR